MSVSTSFVSATLVAGVVSSTQIKMTPYNENCTEVDTYFLPEATFTSGVCQNLTQPTDLLDRSATVTLQADGTSIKWEESLGATCENPFPPETIPLDTCYDDFKHWLKFEKVPQIKMTPYRTDDFEKCTEIFTLFIPEATFTSGVCKDLTRPGDWLNQSAKVTLHGGGTRIMWEYSNSSNCEGGFFPGMTFPIDYCYDDTTASLSWLKFEKVGDGRPTVLPTTPVPAVRTPTPTPSPEIQRATKKIQQTVGAFTSAVSPTTAMGAQRLGFVGSDCDGSLDDVPRWDVSPLGSLLPVGDSPWRFYTGGLVFAVALFAGVFVLHLLVAGVYALFKKVSFAEAAHTVKVSYSCLAVLMLIAEPIGQLGTVAMGGAEGEPVDRAIGAMVMCAFVGLTVYVYVNAFRHQRTAVRLSECDAKVRNEQCWLLRMLVPTADWVPNKVRSDEDESTGQNGAADIESLDYAIAKDDVSLWWSAKCAPLYVDISDRFRYWIVMEIVVAFLLGVCEALQPFVGCTVATAGMACLLLTHTAFACIARPFLIPLDLVMTLIVSVCMTVCGFIKLAFVITRKEQLADIMETSILILATLLLIRAVVDALNFIRRILKILCGVFNFQPRPSNNKEKKIKTTAGDSDGDRVSTAGGFADGRGTFGGCTAVWDSDVFAERAVVEETQGGSPNTLNNVGYQQTIDFVGAAEAEKIQALRPERKARSAWLGLKFFAGLGLGRPKQQLGETETKSNNNNIHVLPNRTLDTATATVDDREPQPQRTVGDADDGRQVGPSPQVSFQQPKTTIASTRHRSQGDLLEYLCADITRSNATIEDLLGVPFVPSTPPTDRDRVVATTTQAGPSSQTSAPPSHHRPLPPARCGTSQGGERASYTDNFHIEGAQIQQLPLSAAAPNRPRNPVKDVCIKDDPQYDIL